MSYEKHIHITGPARSGTTLMKNLMHCYLGGFVTAGERHPELSEWSRMFTVTKFPEDGPELYHNYPGLNVIYMARDPRDMFVSRKEGVRWWNDRNRRQSGCFGDRVDDFLALAGYPKTMVVRYEDLVTEPERVQEEIAERFRLNIRTPFAEGHKWFLEDPRPIDASSIGAWKRDDNKLVVKYFLHSNPEAYRYMEFFGYEEE
jgi:hypothetical protein